MTLFSGLVEAKERRRIPIRLGDFTSATDAIASGKESREEAGRLGVGSDDVIRR